RAVFFRGGSRVSAQVPRRRPYAPPSLVSTALMSGFARSSPRRHMTAVDDPDRGFANMDEQQLGDRQRRAALNQSRFRRINEEREDGQQASSAFIEFTCECWQTTCEIGVPLTVVEYEAIRRVPTHFLVLRGHLAPHAERVVTETDRYQVVEKFGAA